MVTVVVGCAVWYVAGWVGSGVQVDLMPRSDQGDGFVGLGGMSLRLVLHLEMRLAPGSALRGNAYETPTSPAAHPRNNHAT
jgi:hypothetical protein